MKVYFKNYEANSIEELDAIEGLSSRSLRVNCDTRDELLLLFNSLKESGFNLVGLSGDGTEHWLDVEFQSLDDYNSIRLYLSKNYELNN